MEFQGSPLLSNEISGFDINDEEKNKNYSNELQVLYNEIREDLNKLDSYNTGKVSENGLLNYLQSKLPPKRNLNVSLFQQLFQDIEREDDSEIDLDDFTKKYIQAHEELKLNFDTLKKGFDKERSLKGELEQKIQNTKQEQLNKNGMSENSCVSTEIGKVTLLQQIDGAEIFCSVSLSVCASREAAVKEDLKGKILAYSADKSTSTNERESYQHHGYVFDENGRYRTFDGNGKLESHDYAFYISFKWFGFGDAYMTGGNKYYYHDLLIFDENNQVIGEREDDWSGGYTYYELVDSIPTADDYD